MSARAVCKILKLIGGRGWSMLSEEQGQALIAYALLVSVIAIVALGTLAMTGSGASAMIDRITSGVSGSLQQGTSPGTTTTVTTTTTTTTTGKKPKKPKKG